MELLTFDLTPSPYAAFIPGYSPQALLSTPEFAYLAPLVPLSPSFGLMPNPPTNERPWRLSPEVPLYQPLLMTFHDDSLYLKYRGQSVIGIVIALSHPIRYGSREATINARARIRASGRIIDELIPDIRHPGTITLMVPEPATGEWIPVAAYPSELSPLMMGPAIRKVTPRMLPRFTRLPRPSSTLAPH